MIGTYIDIRFNLTIGGTMCDADLKFEDFVVSKFQLYECNSNLFALALSPIQTISKVPNFELLGVEHFKTLEIS